MNATTTGAARAAAEAWADKLFGALPGRDAGLDGDGAVLALLHAVVTARDGSQDREKFVEVMTRHVDARLREGADRLTYATNYGPSYEWRDIIAESGVSPNRFPWKSCMWIRPDHVTASWGYRGADVLLWHAEGWEHPTCGTAEYVDDRTAQYGYRKTGAVCILPRWHSESHTFAAAGALS